jgi:hypothetical protein
VSLCVELPLNIERGKKANGGEVTIPRIIGDLQVTTIGWEAFGRRTNTLTDSTASVADAQWTNSPVRFYRI